MSLSDSTPQFFKKSNASIRTFRFTKVGVSAERGSRLWPWKSSFRVALKCKHERRLALTFFVKVCVDRGRDRAVTLINNHLIISLIIWVFSHTIERKNKRDQREKNNEEHTKYIHLIIVLNLKSIQSYYRTNIINNLNWIELILEIIWMW